MDASVEGSSLSLTRGTGLDTLRSRCDRRRLIGEASVEESSEPEDLRLSRCEGIRIEAAAARSFLSVSSRSDSDSDGGIIHLKI